MGNGKANRTELNYIASIFYFDLTISFIGRIENNKRKMVIQALLSKPVDLKQRKESILSSSKNTQSIGMYESSTYTVVDSDL